MVSPLLALMVGHPPTHVCRIRSSSRPQNNQVAALRAANIKVATLNSTTPKSEKDTILEDLKCGHPLTRLLYVTPEYCVVDYFRRVLRIIHSQRELSRIAIDEAHCVSEWGHDFRKSYEDLSFFKREFPDVPVMCLTATATARVRQDVVSTLGLDARRLKLFTMTTSRPNLHYEVRFKSDEQDHYDDFLGWLKGVHARRSSRPARASQLAAQRKRIDNVSGIIYTLFRADCERLAARLRRDGVGAKAYHAGLSTAEKSDTLAGWVENRAGYDVIVATTAFGMGIDKEDVRFVVHWQIPKSFEGFYQEAGRAGRDGKAAICVTYYGREDRDRAANMLAREQARNQYARGGAGGAAGGRGGAAGSTSNALSRAKSLQALVAYCENTGQCRHQSICDYFGEEITPVCEWACDWHKAAKALAKRKEEGLASEEWCSTQREMGAYADDDYD